MGIPDSIDNAIKNVTDEPTKGIGKTFSDIWYLVMGGISFNAEKKRLSYSYKLEEFKNSLENKILSIPPEKQVEADLQIVCPALESARYCVDKEELREMFSQLISNSMNLDKKSFVHPCFPGMILQMSQLDARNISLFNNNTQLPIVEYRYIFGQSHYKIVETNVFQGGQDNFEQNQASINNLNRLGLIKIDYLHSLTKEGTYDLFEEHPVYKAMEKQVVSEPVDGFQSPRDDNLIQKISYEKGIVELTNLGTNFIKTCL